MKGRCLCLAIREPKVRELSVSLLCLTMAGYRLSRLRTPIVLYTAQALITTDKQPFSQYRSLGSKSLALWFCYVIVGELLFI